jgi:hypothetical protein
MASRACSSGFFKIKALPEKKPEVSTFDMEAERRPADTDYTTMNDSEIAS